MVEWKYVIVGWGVIIHNDALSMSEKRDKLVKLLKKSKWYKEQGDTEVDRECSDLGMAIEEFEDADCDEWMEQVLDGIYDLADGERTWLTPERKPRWAR